MTATACGKVILLGEHAVVYNRPALAAGLPRGAEATFLPGPGGPFLHVSPWNITVSSQDDTDLGHAFAALIQALPGNHTPEGTVQATVYLPGGAGLGSSAALAVAVARALGPITAGRPLERNEVHAAALAWERVCHGNPSGIDHTVAADGGIGVFTRTTGFEPMDIHTPLRLVIADTGERSRTVDMVAMVARMHARRPETTEKTFDAIAALVRNGALALRAGDLPGLGQLMNLNQALLASLFLSTERIETFCRAAREAGALGAKLTGAGGGGCVIALPGQHEHAVVNAWKALGATVFVTDIGHTPERNTPPLVPQP